VRVHRPVIFSQELDVSGDLETAVSSRPKFEVILDVAFKNRPEPSDIHHRTQTDQELATIVKAGDKPRLDLKAGGGRRDLDVVASGQQADGTTGL
jgi:hypothetical protein